MKCHRNLVSMIKIIKGFFDIVEIMYYRFMAKLVICNISI